MELWELLLLSAVLSIDSLNIGAACGFAGVRIPFLARLIIMGMTVILTSAAVGLGGILQESIGSWTAKLLSAALLFGLGVYIAVGAVKKLVQKRRQDKTDKGEDEGAGILPDPVRILRDSEYCDADCSKRIEVREALAIGLALSGDSAAAGLGTGVGAGSMAALIPLLCGVFQMVLMLCGEAGAHLLTKHCPVRGEWFTVVSGLLLAGAALWKGIAG